MREDICAGATWTSTSEQTSSDSSSAPSFTSRSANKIEPEHEHERRQEDKEPPTQDSEQEHTFMPSSMRSFPMSLPSPRLGGTSSTTLASRGAADVFTDVFTSFPATVLSPRNVFTSFPAAALSPRVLLRQNSLSPCLTSSPTPKP